MYDAALGAAHDGIASRRRRLGPGLLRGLKLGVNVISRSEALEVRYELHELAVVHIVEPGRARHGVVRVENVRGGRVVQYDRLTEIATEPAQILSVQ